MRASRPDTNEPNGEPFGGKFGWFTHAVLVSCGIGMICTGRLTLLNELEAIFNVALIAREKEASVLDGPAFSHLLFRDFWAVLDSTPDDTADCGSTKFGKVASRVRFANMCCEGAPVLAGLIVGIQRGEGEIVVL